MSYSTYSQYLSILCLNPCDLDEEYEELGNISTFEILIGSCSQGGKDFVCNALSLFFVEPVRFQKEYSFFYLGEIKDRRYITKENYEMIKTIIRKMSYMIDKEDERPIFGNERAREMWELIKKNRKKIPVAKQNINFASIVSGVAWKSQNVNIITVWDLTIYQLYDAYYRLDVIDTYDKTVTGIYAGNVDGTKINLKDLNWSKKINFKDGDL